MRKRNNMAICSFLSLLLLSTMSAPFYVGLNSHIRTYEDNNITDVTVSYKIPIELSNYLNQHNYKIQSIVTNPIVVNVIHKSHGLTVKNKYQITNATVINGTTKGLERISTVYNSVVLYDGNDNELFTFWQFSITRGTLLGTHEDVVFGISHISFTKFRYRFMFSGGFCTYSINYNEWDNDYLQIYSDITMRFMAIGKTVHCWLDSTYEWDWQCDLYLWSLTGDIEIT